MENKTPNDLTRMMISKQAVLDGLSERAEQLAHQLETTLHQINELNQEIAAINELQHESSDNPETQDPPNSTRTLLPPDLEPVNHPEDQ